MTVMAADAALVARRMRRLWRIVRLTSYTCVRARVADQREMVPQAPHPPHDGLSFRPLVLVHPLVFRLHRWYDRIVESAFPIVAAGSYQDRRFSMSWRRS
jgi:hypothetical protein